MATPFEPEGVDEVVLTKLVEFQISQGVDGLVPCGTTGESPTLAWDEHQRLVELVVEKAEQRVGTLAGTGSNNTAEAIAATRDALHAGASAALMVDCYYNGPSSRELRQRYYEPVLSAVPDLPLVPYVIPGRTGCALSAGDLAALHAATPERIPAVKEATGDLDRMREERTLCGPSLSILSGDDDMTLAMMRDGDIQAAGAISVMSNIVPKGICDMVTASMAGDHTTAETVAETLSPLLSLVGVVVPSETVLPNGQRVQGTDKFRNPVPVKTMMAGLGMLPSVSGLFRGPLGCMTQPAVAKVRAALRQVHQADPRMLAPVGEHFDVSIEKRLNDDAVWSSLVG